MPVKFSLNKLSTETGYDRSTIRKRVNSQTPEDGEYTIRQVMDGYENYGAENKNFLNLQQETARLRKLQADALQRVKESEEGTIAGSVSLQKAHDIMEQVAWVIGVVGRQHFLGEVHKIGTDQDRYQEWCDLSEQAYQNGIVAMLAQISADRIPEAVKQGLLSGFSTQLNVPLEDLKGITLRMSEHIKKQSTQESNDSK